MVRFEHILCFLKIKGSIIPQWQIQKSQKQVKGFYNPANALCSFEESPQINYQSSQKYPMVTGMCSFKNVIEKKQS